MSGDIWRFLFFVFSSQHPHGKQKEVRTDRCVSVFDGCPVVCPEHQPKGGSIAKERHTQMSWIFLPPNVLGLNVQMSPSMLRCLCNAERFTQDPALHGDD